MKLLTLFITFAAPWLAAESITEGDRAYLLDHLAMTRESVVNALRGLSKAQLLFKPAAHRWSVAQCIGPRAVARIPHTGSSVRCARADRAGLTAARQNGSAGGWFRDTQQDGPDEKGSRYGANGAAAGRGDHTGE